MKPLLFLVLISVMETQCSNPKKIVERNDSGKFIYQSGFFSGIEYIMITKKSASKKDYVIRIQCNYYDGGIWRSIMSKEMFDKKGDVASWGFYHDLTDFMNHIHYESQKKPKDQLKFIPLSSEEYDVLKTAFQKYHTQAEKYKLNADSLKNYLGWYELKN